MLDLLIKNIRTHSSPVLFHLGVKNNRLQFVASSARASKTVEGEGGIVLPPFVEMHHHADTYKAGERVGENKSGTIEEGIAIWDSAKSQLVKKELTAQMEDLVSTFIGQGILYTRWMIDVSEPGLKALSCAIAVKERYKNTVGIEITAFPQLGMKEPWKRELLEKALQMGADQVSAVPHLEESEEQEDAAVQECFRLAQQYKKGIHIFCDETENPDSMSSSKIAEAAVKGEHHDLSITISHVNALSYYEETKAAETIQKIKQAGIHVISCPLINSTTIGKSLDSRHAARGITRVKALRDQGVNVCVAHDDIKTPFYPFGNGNMLQAGYMMAHLAQFTTEPELISLVDMLTYNGAKAMNVQPYGIKEDGPAEFLLYKENDLFSLFTEHSKPFAVCKNGIIIS